MEKTGSAMLFLLAAAVGAGAQSALHVGVPMAGIVFAADKAPGRVISLRADLADLVSLSLEPIVGLGPVKGAGLSAGVYAMASPTTHVGVRGAWYSLEQNDAEREVFVELQKVFRPRHGGGFSIRYGAGLGYGLRGIQHGELDGDPDAIIARDGATFRVNLDFSWRVSSWGARPSAESAPAKPEAPIKEELDAD